MIRSRNYKTLSPSLDYWMLVSLVLIFLLIYFSFLLIKERLFLNEMNFYLSRHKIDINFLSQFAINSNLLVNQPTKLPLASSVDSIYLQPPEYSYNNTFLVNEF
ncbi:MAG: hypothetical protein NZ822_01610 [Patescibacteria group bacterium]|nr:hypothetical protein [Patescibacteria group bacterium]